MTTKLVKVLNTQTGSVGWLRPRVLRNKAILNSENLVEVKEDTKPYAKKTYKPRTGKKFTEDHPDKVAVPAGETPAIEEPNKDEDE